MFNKPPAFAREPLTLRLKRSYCVLPLVMLPILQVIFHAMLHLEPEKNQEMSPAARWSAQCMLVFVPGFFNLLCVFLLFAYLRLRITINDTHLISQGVFLRRRIPLAEITQVIWPSPSRRPPILIVQGLRSRVKIAFYENHEAFPGQCVQQLRDAFPAKLQIGWQEFQKEHDAPPRLAPRIRWLALVSAFLYLLVPALCILAFFRISRELPGGLLFTFPDVDDGRQKLVQAAAIFVGVCVICIVLAVYYVYRCFTFRETPVVTK